MKIKVFCPHCEKPFHLEVPDIKAGQFVKEFKLPRKITKVYDEKNPNVGTVE